MKKAQLPLNEEVRLAELEAYNILDSSSEQAFDDLALLLQQVSGCAYVAISFIDKDRQWLKASQGFEMISHPREFTFCSHTILEHDVMLVQDAKKDDRFSDNPLVTEGLHIRFYAGVPIVSANGYNIGTVCAFDSQLREFSPEQQRAISIIADQVTQLLELRKKNAIILNKASELIDKERTLLKHTLLEQEKERRSIGIELHENYAQVLAACLMYLNIAAESRERSASFIAKTQQALTNLLEDMRRLSKTYNPISVHAISLEDVVREFVGQFAKEVPFEMRLDWKGGSDDIPADQALNLFRILSQYLEIVSQRQEITKVNIQVKVTSVLDLRIVDDGLNNPADNSVSQFAEDAILSRVAMMEGRYEVKVHADRGCVFHVLLPFKRNEVGVAG